MYKKHHIYVGSFQMKKKHPRIMSKTLKNLAVLVGEAASLLENEKVVYK